MDHKPRAFSVHEIQILSDLAAIVEDEFRCSTRRPPMS
jgi:hypothetical protein